MDQPGDKQMHRAGPLFVLWLILFGAVFTVLSISTARMGRLQWQVESGRPIPDEFAYVYFPRAGEAPVRAEDSDARIGAVDRALIVTQSQLESGEATLILEDDVGRVRIADLRAAPDPRRGEEHIENWKRHLRQLDEPSWYVEVDVSYEESGDAAEEDGAGYRRAVFRGVRGDGAVDRFTYATDGEYTEALRWVRRTGEGGALNLAANVLSAAVLAGVATIAFVGVNAVLARRRRRGAGGA